MLGFSIVIRNLVFSIEATVSWSWGKLPYRPPKLLSQKRRLNYVENDGGKLI